MGSKLWDIEVQQRENAWLEGRDANLAAYKRGVDNVMLMFSSRDGELAVEFPWMQQFTAAVQSLIHQVRSQSWLSYQISSQTLLMSMQRLMLSS